MEGEGTLVITPAWNEEASVGEVVREVRRVLPLADVLVVDDGSADGTAEAARDAGATVSRLPYNLGVGGAIRVGYRYAWRHGYRTVAQIDADRQHDPTDLPRLLSALDGTDIVIGARFAGVGDYHVDPLRRFAMRLLARRVSRITGTPLTDVTSGLRVSGPRAVALFARSYPVEYIGATVEALVIAARSGLRVSQVGVQMRERRTGRPSQGLVKSAVYVLRALAVIALSRVQSWPPPDTRRRLRYAARIEERGDRS